jgi:prepilin-type N-terminal cleavage/methylation domain-containing protein/prepilin-type processing-associated H-X9-DG protein
LVSGRPEPTELSALYVVLYIVLSRLHRHHPEKAVKAFWHTAAKEGNARMYKARRKGFTLIELLVVIAIIAILAAILFPVFARARAKARQAKCQSNLKQLGLAFLMYTTDNDEMLPAWGYGDTGSPNNGVAEGFYSWDSVIMPYMRNQDILICPNNPFPEGRTARGYAMTRYTGDAYGTDLPLWMDYMPKPAETVLLFDKGHLPPGSNGDSAGEAFFQSQGCTGQGLKTDMFHNNGKNFLYVDGHVKFHAKDSGPFAHETAGPCPPSGWSGHSLYETHGPGHCETAADWPS